MLLERDQAISQFENVAKGISTAGKVLLVSGEAGIGKTALLEHMRETLEPNISILWSGCDPLFTPRPYAPVYDIAALISPELLLLLESSGSPSKLFSVFYHAFERLKSPVLLIIEDIHWADHATLDLLKFFVRRISFIPCLLCLTYRDDEVSAQHPLSSMLSLIPSAHSIRIQLSHLSVNAVKQLSINTHHKGQNLFDITGGNPFFVTELLANNEGSGRSVPASIRDALGARIANLIEPERTLLQLLSLIPYSIPVMLIEHLFGKQGESYAMACVARKLLQCDVKLEFRFKHELARLAIQSGVSLGEQKNGHAKILKGLEALNLRTNLAWLAHHSEGALDAKSVLQYAPTAAKNAADLGAHKEAASFYSKALKFVEYADSEVAATLYENWAYEVGLTTHMNQSVIDARRHAITLWRALNRKDKIGENLRWLSRLYWYQGQAERAEYYANEAIATFESINASSELAMAYSLRSQLDMLNARTTDAIKWGNKALALEKKFPNPAVRVHALNNVGTTLLMHGDESGEELLNESLDLGEANGLHEDVARVYTNYSDCYVRFKKLAMAEDLISKGIHYDVSHDLDSWTYYLLGIQAQLRQEQGRFIDAQTIAAGVQQVKNQTLLMKLPALTVQAKVSARMQMPEAKQLLDQALKNANATDELQYMIPARLSLIEYHWLNCFSADNSSKEAGRHLHWLCELPDKVLNTWQLGELKVWIKRYNLTLQLTSSVPTPPVYQHELANQHLQAFNAWQKLSMPFDAAMCIVNTVDSTRPKMLEQAYAIAAEIGAKALMNWIRQIIQRQNVDAHLPMLKRGPYGKAKHHPMGLTGKEQSILKLIVTGASNQEIAAQLSRSNRTIENHVSSILKKLKVENRIEAVLQVQNQPWLSD